MDNSKVGFLDVVIIDDDYAPIYKPERLRQYGVNEQVSKKLMDKSDRNTTEWLKIMQESGLPSENLEQRLEAFSKDDVAKKAPGYYKKELIEVVENRIKEQKPKLDSIKDWLVELGVSHDGIHFFNDGEKALEYSKNNSPDLFIVDLMLDESTESTGLIKDLFNHDYIRKNSQFILMSYHTEKILDNFRTLHKSLKISSSRFKVINKPKGNDISSEIQWKHVFIQLDIEKEFMREQDKFQNSWSACVDEAAKKLKDKIWEWDSRHINRLRLSAEADHISFSDYFSEIMAKHIVSVFESSGAPKEEMNLLSSKMSMVDNKAFILNSSLEVKDPYEELKIMLADINSHRFEWCDSIESITSFPSFLMTIKFGTILKKDNEYFLNITPPCDYIHLKEERSKSEGFLFIPGVSFDSYKEENDGNKKHITPFITIENNIQGIKWNLRNPITSTVYEVYESIKKYSIVGQLKPDIAQIISNKFASAISRGAEVKVPRFEDLYLYHFYFNPQENDFSLKCTDKDVKVNIKEFCSGNALTFPIKRYKDSKIQPNKKEYHTVMIESSAVYDLVKNIVNPQEKLRELCLDLIYGLKYEDSSFEKNYDNISLIINSKLDKTLNTNLTKARKLYKEKQEILNLLIIKLV
ncbi:hypothetical protein HLB27_00860 [Dickeya dadantii]|uniref:hypothetical protein n=1 Tax=Dickeya dadantii TaxID=204038 RepID=UPI0014957734|nr:hypothetical protein [Dickeya dadantii]NPE57822.1 hypothetical protein [Dickeya dadantii]NPE69372.1 hypothetical protein [Dickeya dadantii]